MKHRILCILTAAILFSLVILTDSLSVKCEPIEKTMTLMVYMIGSDLESGSGSARDDIKEMQNSGVDFDKVNILIYTGGSKKWHNKDIPSDKNGFFRLTADGLQLLESNPLKSMGESDTLTDFIESCRTAFPAGHYGLILWDHGSGPLIGYGMDTQFNNDALTLNEIRDALAASSFDAQNKLDFIGFDACLMSSAELVCTVDDYADYLIASQEIEPSFGWNYAFLKNCGKAGTKEFVSGIVDDYLSFCEDYFSQKKFFSSDVTLAAMNLSDGEELESALNQVFAKAASDVSGDYSKLAAERIRSKGLGRATTSSEYDLVDLQDLMGYMSERYPKEAGKVLEVLEKMVVRNGTNTDNCSGLSIYYPYYNKKYYQKSWKETYEGLNLFPEYLTYLSRYDQIWLGTDMQEYFEGALVPAEKAKGEYTLQLTDEQQEHFASANYYLLRRTGDELFQQVYVSSDVTNKKGALKANFDGKVIYFDNGLSTPWIPFMTESDSSEGTTYYSVLSYFYSNQYDYNLADMFAGNAQIQIAADHQTEKVAVKSVLEWDPKDEGNLTGGKRTEIDPQNYRKIVFPNSPARYLTRNQNGTLKAFSEWTQGHEYDGHEVYAADGIAFSCEPIYDDGSEYFLMFEITDVQNNVYSSELLPVSLAKAPEKEKTAAAEVKMDSSGSCRVYDGNNITVDLFTNLTYEENIRSYVVSLQNRNDFPVDLTLYVDRLNENTMIESGHAIYAAPGETVYYSYPIISRNCTYADIAFPEILDVSLELRNEETGKTLLYGNPVRIAFPESLDFQTAWLPLYGVLAEEQKLADTDGLRIDLLHAGYTLTDNEYALENSNSKSLTFVFMLENTGKEDIYYSFKEIRLDKEKFPCYECGYLQPGMQIPVHFRLNDEDLREAGIKAVSSASLLVSVDGNDPFETAPIAFVSETSKPVRSVTQSDTPREDDSGVPAAVADLYSDHNLCIRLHKAKDYETDSDFCFLEIINCGDETLELELGNLIVNQKFNLEGMLYYDDIEAGQTVYHTMYYLNRILAPAGIQDVTQLAMDLRFSAKDKEDWTEESVDVGIPAVSDASVCVSAYLDAKAEKQVLLDNERVRITLLYCGRLQERYGIKTDNMSGLICFENKTKENLPIAIGSMTVNGITLDPIRDPSCILPGGEKIYRTFYLYQNQFEEEKISSIESLSILLLSDFSELTGTYTFESSLDGGTWYKIVLSESGVSDQSEIEGKLVFDSGNVQVYYQSQEIEEIPYNETYSGSWNFTAVNTGEETFEIDISDIQINGEPDRTGLFENKIYADKSVVAPGTKASFKIYTFHWEEKQLPDLAFQFRLLSAGGGTILYQSEEPCVIPSGT